MAMRCDLDKCSLKDDIDEIKAGQEVIKLSMQTQALSTATLVQKVDDYIVRGEKEHDILFSRTRDIVKKDDIKGVVRWPLLLSLIASGCGIAGVIFTAMKVAAKLSGV